MIFIFKENKQYKTTDLWLEMEDLRTLNRCLEGDKRVHEKPECCFTQGREYLEREVASRCVIRALIKRTIGMNKVSLSRSMLWWQMTAVVTSRLQWYLFELVSAEGTGYIEQWQCSLRSILNPPCLSPALEYVPGNIYRIFCLFVESQGKTRGSWEETQLYSNLNT